jgi:hypothetical protein
MKVTGQRHVTDAPERGETFNNCEHLFVRLDPGKCQTISVQLPNGKHVTFGFIPSGDTGEFECVDLHCTMGRPFRVEGRVGKWFHRQHLAGFSADNSATVFDTRQQFDTPEKRTTLATLLLHPRYYKV